MTLARWRRSFKSRALASVIPSFVRSEGPRENTFRSNEVYWGPINFKWILFVNNRSPLNVAVHWEGWGEVSKEFSQSFFSTDSTPLAPKTAMARLNFRCGVARYEVVYTAILFVPTEMIAQTARIFFTSIEIFQRRQGYPSCPWSPTQDITEQWKID